MIKNSFLILLMVLVLVATGCDVSQSPLPFSLLDEGQAIFVDEEAKIETPELIVIASENETAAPPGFEFPPEIEDL